MNVKYEPEKYIDSPNLDNLFLFLSGIIMYHWYLNDEGVASLPGFREYICTKYKDPGLGYGYMQIIRMYADDDKKAFYHFYELLEEFVEIKGSSYVPFESQESLEKGYNSAQESLWVLLNETHEKWNIFLGRKSLAGLKIFLNGAKSYCEMIENKKLKILPGFDKYVAERFEVKNEMDFFYVIEENSSDCAYAFDCFYELMFDYMKIMGDEYKPISGIW